MRLTSAFAVVVTAAFCASAYAIPASELSAQSASIVYRLGADTVAIEQYTRSGNKLSGEMVQRAGAAVIRVVYEVTVGADGRPASATISRLNGDGTPLANAPTSTRFRLTGDSAVREAVFADSVQRRAFAVGKAFVNFPVYVYGPTELLAALKRTGASVDSIPALGLAGNPGMTGLQSAGGDTLRMRGGPYAMLFRYDANNRLQSVDGTFTTNKIIASRGTKTFDIAAVARGMKPTGVLSVREVARGAFGSGGMVLVDYSRPMVRDRSVWGGTLIPFDSVWRAGANDAAHLFTTRTLALGNLTLVPGMYTLWVQHTKGGTFLIVNKQTGQWGTQYDAAHDLGRVAMQMSPAPNHVEEFTIAVKALGGNRGSLEMAWGPNVLSVPFTASVAAAR